MKDKKTKKEKPTKEEIKKKISDFLPLGILIIMVCVIVVLLVSIINNSGSGAGAGGGTGSGGSGGGASPGTPQSYDFYGFTNGDKFITYFNTSCAVSDYSGMTNSKFRSVCQKVDGLLKKYHVLFDIYNEYDGVVNLAYINARAGEGPIEVSLELFDFLEYAIGVCNMTGGEVNIAMGAVLSIWHNYREAGLLDPSNARIPTMAELSAAAEHISLSDVVLNRENMTVELRDPEMALDVGAIGKGYTAEIIANELIADGVSSFVINLGGNLKVIGEKSSGQGWITGVLDPTGFGYIETFEVKDTAVVTSGDYQRYYLAGGVKYHHIIDPDTLMPTAEFTSVTIITQNSALADGLSTALFCMNYEDGLAIIEGLRGEGVKVDVVWYTLGGQVIKSLGTVIER